MINFPVGDFLIRIKNAAQAKQSELKAPATKEKVAVAQVLKKAGFVENYAVKSGNLELKLKFSHKKPVLMDIKLVSKPGRRIYMKVDDIRGKKGPSLYLLNSPKGVVTSKEAIKAGVGGEVIAEVW